MRVIKYIDLYKYFIEVSKLSKIATIRNILRVRLLPSEYRSLVADILEKKVPTKCVDGVSFEELVSKDKMDPIYAIFFLEWLSRDPIPATEFMESQRLRSAIQPLSEHELEIVKAALRNAKEIEPSSVKDEVDTQTIQEGEDIVVD